MPRLQAFFAATGNYALLHKPATGVEGNLHNFCTIPLRAVHMELLRIQELLQTSSVTTGTFAASFYHIQGTIQRNEGNKSTCHAGEETAGRRDVRDALTRNLCLACMLEAVRATQKIIDIEIVNRVLIQPHWRKDVDLDQF